MTIGWQLATPAARSAAIATPGGAGGLGNAPARHTKPAPAAGSSAMRSRPLSAMPTVSPSALVSKPDVRTTVPVSAGPTSMPSVPSTEDSEDPLPPLTLPPVPTPTEPDALPSMDPSDWPPPSDLGFGERHFRWSGR